MTLETQTDLHQACDALLRWFLSQELSNQDAMAVMTVTSIFLLQMFTPKDIENHVSRLIKLTG